MIDAQNGRRGPEAPSKRRGRWAVWACASAAGGVLTLAGIASVDLLAERWHIWRLHSTADATRLDAAARLANRGSVAAVPHLLRIIEEGRQEAAYGSGRHICLTPIAHALYRVGPRAIQEIERAANRIGLAPHPLNPFDVPWVISRVQSAIRYSVAAEVERIGYGDARHRSFNAWTYR